MSINIPSKAANEQSANNLKLLKETYNKIDNLRLAEKTSDEVIESLIKDLKAASKNNVEIHFYDLSSRLREAAEILSQSGEVSYYKNANHRLSLKYSKPSIIKRILSI